MAHRWWVLVDRRGIVIGSDGSVNGIFFSGFAGLYESMVWFDGFFFLTWFCFWFDGPVVVLGYMRVVLRRFGCGW